jgi:hypothetical protein
MAINVTPGSGLTLKSRVDGSDHVVAHDIAQMPAITIAGSQSVGITGSVTTSATIAPPTSNVHGKVTVTTAATRVQVSASSVPLTRGAWIRATHTNAGIVYLGGSTVAAANGYDMSARDAVFVECSNLNQLYIDASVNAQSISYIGF